MKLCEWAFSEHSFLLSASAARRTLNYTHTNPIDVCMHNKVENVNA